QHGPDRERMAEIMDARPARPPVAEPRGTDEANECPVDVVVDQAALRGGHEEAACASARSEPVAVSRVLHERLRRRRVPRHFTRLAELRLANDEHAVAAVDVVLVEGDSLASA